MEILSNLSKKNIKCMNTNVANTFLFYTNFAKIKAVTRKPV